MDWLYWHLLDQIATETDQSLLIFSPCCSLVSLLIPAQCLLVCTRILKETWRNICLDWKKTESRGNAGQKLAVQKSSFKFPSNYWHDTRSMPAIFFAVSNLVQSSRYQAGVIWLQCSQSIKKSSSCFVSSVKNLLFLFLKRQNQVKAAGSSVEVAVISILFFNDVISWRNSNLVVENPFPQVAPSSKVISPIQQ